MYTNNTLAQTRCLLSPLQSIAVQPAAGRNPPGSNGSGSSPSRARRSITASAFLSSARQSQRPASTWRSAASAAHCAAATGPAARVEVEQRCGTGAGGYSELLV
jgi:hypothetical protein